MNMLQADHLTVRYGRRTVVEDLSFSLEEGRWLMLIGPNGAGKSTVVRAISQGVGYTGTIRVLGTDARSYRPAQLARQIGVLSQSHSVSYPFTVGELVRLGRYSCAPGLFSRRQDDRDAEAVDRALELTGMTEFADQSLLALSGGELQRAFLAQLFAQEPRILILDEPTNHLDLIYQKQTFELISRWLRTGSGAVLSVVHDLSLARRYGTDAVLMDGGRCAAQGPVDTVFRPEFLDSAYRMDVRDWMQQMLSQWA